MNGSENPCVAGSIPALDIFFVSRFFSLDLAGISRLLLLAQLTKIGLVASDLISLPKSTDHSVALAIFFFPKILKKG